MKKKRILSKGIAVSLLGALLVCPMAAYADELVPVSNAPGASVSYASEGAYTISDSPLAQPSGSVGELSLHSIEVPEYSTIDLYSGPGALTPSSGGTSSVSGSGSGSVSTGGSSSSGRVGINHASDAATTVELGFKVVSPKVQRGGFYVAEGSVQLSDGSWATIGHELNLKNPYFRVLREETDSQGVQWYVCASLASRFGDYYTADGSLATELWLKKSDCNEMTSITLNTTNQTRINIVKTAFENLGDDYTYGMTGPDEFDCSGFVNYVFSQAGISVPRQSSAICQMAGQISIEDLRPGDIVGRSGHVGVYVGGGIFIHSSETITGVIAEYVDVYNTSGAGFTNYINAVGD